MRNVLPIDAWTDEFADNLRNNIVCELEQKGLKGQQVEEAIRHIMIYVRQWLETKPSTKCEECGCEACECCPEHGATCPDDCEITGGEQYF